MVSPAMLSGLGVAAGGAAQLGTALFGDDAPKDNFSKQAWTQEFRESKRRFDNLIQTRVADAKAAGVHPLFALGASGGGGSITSGYIDPVREHDSSSSRARDFAVGAERMTRGMAGLMESKLKAEIAKDEAMAMKLASEAKTAEMSAVTRPLAPLTLQEPVPIPARAREGSSRTAGVKPTWQKIQVGVNPDGSPKTITVLATDDMSEAFEFGPAVMAILRSLGAFGDIDPSRRELRRKGRFTQWR